MVQLNDIKNAYRQESLRLLSLTVGQHKFDDNVHKYDALFHHAYWVPIPTR